MAAAEERPMALQTKHTHRITVPGRAAEIVDDINRLHRNFRSFFFDPVLIDENTFEISFKSKDVRNLNRYKMAFQTKYKLDNLGELVEEKEEMMPVEPVVFGGRKSRKSKSKKSRKSKSKKSRKSKSKKSRKSKSRKH
jgi:hypothetical protein